MRDIAIARTSLFPLGKPQERVLNFIPMLARHGRAAARADARARGRAREPRSSRGRRATHRMSGSPRPAERRRAGAARASGRAATLVATGILLSRLAGLVRQHFLARYLGLERRGGRVQRRVPHSELPAESVRRRRALRVVHPGVRAAAREWGRGGSVDASRALCSSLLAVATSLLVLVGIARTPVLIAAHRARIRRCEARAHDHARAHPLSRRRAARALRLVSRRSEQPSALSHLVLGADRLEHRDHRRARLARRARGGVRPRGRGGVGIGGRAARRSCSCRCRR